MTPEYGKNFLLSFDYKLPPLSKPVKQILYIHSSQTDQSFLSLKKIDLENSDFSPRSISSAGWTSPRILTFSVKYSAK